MRHFAEANKGDLRSGFPRSVEIAMKNFNSQDILLRTKQIIGDSKSGLDPIIPVSRSDWFAGVKSGKYPPSDVRLGARTVFWRLSTIQKFIAEGANQVRNHHE